MYRRKTIEFAQKIDKGQEFDSHTLTMFAESFANLITKFAEQQQAFNREHSVCDKANTILASNQLDHSESLRISDGMLKRYEEKARVLGFMVSDQVDGPRRKFRTNVADQIAELAEEKHFYADSSQFDRILAVHAFTHMAVVNRLMIQLRCEPSVMSGSPRYLPDVPESLLMHYLRTFRGEKEANNRLRDAWMQNNIPNDSQNY